ncbi:MAG: potassium transporter, partial [Paramuribaculum sp.]|nr:potassium transporter [Paramuribaculum sp.]
IYSQMLLRDMIYSRSMSALVPTLFYILGFTLMVEAIGAVAIWLSVTGTLGMTLEEEVAFAAFHSLSSFCNAGFSTLPQGLSNPMLLAAGNNSIYWVTTTIVVAGSIGFPILVNLRDAVIGRISELRARIRHREHEPHNVHPFNMNTKIVITTFMALLIAGAAAFLWLEWDNTLAGMTLWQKITQAAFNSATPRSAGFSSVNPASFRDITLVAVIFLMWVGGAAQSTGGGVKVNTLAAILLNLRAIVTGRPYVTAFRRTISVNSIRRANAVIALSIISYLIFSLLLLGMEPQLSTRSLLFESCSALFTVGSSLGATPLLSDASKILLCAAMFLGRVGIISLLTGIAGRQKAAIQPRYPSDNIIIN